jgi:hypothetical protein
MADFLKAAALRTAGQTSHFVFVVAKCDLKGRSIPVVGRPFFFDFLRLARWLGALEAGWTR